MCFVTDCQKGRLLGSKTLGTNVLELHFIKFSLGLDLLKVWFDVSLESSNFKKLLFNLCKAQSIEE